MNLLKWYGTPSDINMFKSISCMISQYNYRFEPVVFKYTVFDNKIHFKSLIKAPAGCELMTWRLLADA